MNPWAMIYGLLFVTNIALMVTVVRLSRALRTIRQGFRMEPTCTICGADTTMEINGVGTCDEHIAPVMDLVVETLAMEHGLESDDVKRRILAMLRGNDD